MKDICGTVGFIIAAMAMFRIVFGGWPPATGNFGHWISSDPKAVWSVAASVTAGIVGAFIGRVFINVLNKREGKIGEASDCTKRGFRYHQQGKIIDAISMFKRAIEIYSDIGRLGDTDHWEKPILTREIWILLRLPYAKR